MIDYGLMLNKTRLRESSNPNRKLLTESESDRGRVLFSPAFRRLQQKAQVFSMEPNAAVRSRLTHSLEVSQLGRYLADEICQRLLANTPERLDQFQVGAFVNFVETACLMHDIGNPPFGHFGEAAIQQWFLKNGKECLAKALRVQGAEIEGSGFEETAKNALADFHEFDGNPQGVRIVCRLQWNKDPYGLNLTKTTLASFLKYLRGPGDGKEGLFCRKPGFFSTERRLIQEVWKQFEYEKPQRFPLAYIMEAADDIAYCISDLEDAFEKNVSSERSTLEAIKNIYLEENFCDADPCHKEILSALECVCAGKMVGPEFTYTDFRTHLNTALVAYAADKFVKNETAIESGALKSLLPEDEPPGVFLKILKRYCQENVYNHVAIQRIELAGYNAIVGLLEQFRPLLSATHDRFMKALNNEQIDAEGERILLESKFLKMFPEKYVKVYKHEVENPATDGDFQVKEWNHRAHLIVDFISGMTDDFAMTTYRNLAGMEL